jgi:hypothetical protein
MKNLVLTAAVLGAASLATACTTLGNVTATWTLQDWDDAGKAPKSAVCPAGGDTAIVYALPATETNTALADKDLFNCTDGRGTTAGHIADSYKVWVEITSHDGATLYAQSNSQTVSISDGTNAPLTFPFQVNRGYVAAAWTLKGGSTGNTLNCTQAGAGGVEFDNMVGTAIPISDQFNCTDGTGTTYPLPIANYTTTLQAVNSASPPVGIGPGTVAGASNVQFGNQLINKGSFVLSIDGK